MVPTANGNSTPGHKSTPLSRRSARALKAVNSSVAAALKKVATSSEFGAPDTKFASNGHTQVSSTIPEASFAGSLKALGRSLLGGGGRPLGLLLGLAVISVAAAAVARNRGLSR